MIFEQPRSPLRLVERERPTAGPGQALIRVRACGVCRTDLHLLDGEVAVPAPPRILGHQIVGTIEAIGAESPTAPAGEETAAELALGARVGVPWLGFTCGSCRYCRSGRENLCPQARFTGRDIDGGFADWTVADLRYCFPIPAGFSDIQAAPLLCAGLIGYRALRFCEGAHRIGLYGFGASAHILAQVIRHQQREVFAFTRAGDREAQELARSLGADWVGSSEQAPPVELEAAIIFAPLGPLMTSALRVIAPGGAVVSAGIHMSDIPSFPYSLLWMERSLRSVANLTRRDGHELLALAPQVPIKTHVSTYPLERVNEALDELRGGRLTGAAVVTIA
ncbi:MAG TPA: zinc-dependent alcohol dehydrogenase family protein [Solirubrobacteraceae bacterium]|nr:zinc-dependent alcohol dehydrogenase family protein [Solirubrobacteraceae bacterium]